MTDVEPSDLELLIAGAVMEDPRLSMHGEPRYAVALGKTFATGFATRSLAEAAVRRVLLKRREAWRQGISLSDILRRVNATVPSPDSDGP